MYESVVSSVRVQDFSENPPKISITDYFKCLSGVKQGCILSPILFSIFISEFEKELSIEFPTGQ